MNSSGIFGGNLVGVSFESIYLALLTATSVNSFGGMRVYFFCLRGIS